MKATLLTRVAPVAALVTAGLLSAGTAADAAPKVEQKAAAQFRCGFYVGSDASANYGHCDAPPRTDVIINVELGWGGDSGNYDMCVKPGVTKLGTYPAVWYAKYTGRLCWAG
ncbi:DUF6355 family natural product biosynthesis protein [Actinomadura chokoriensis]|uniref:DUF6355 family natural product biosynthesis protein n=1 Tax=Actinomadura chokoriensis TaxID=454156 RepID=A0ABV4R6D1_9ACTN